MDESLITIVVDEKKPDEDGVELEIRLSDDVLIFYLDHKKMFAGDWSGNFLEVFKRALKLWDQDE